METIRSRWTQPGGADIRLGYGRMNQGDRWWSIRRVDYHMQELWNGWTKETIERQLATWEAFEVRIGSRANPHHYDV